MATSRARSPDATRFGATLGLVTRTRRRRERRYGRPGPWLLALALVVPAVASASTAASRTATLPTVKCPVVAGIDGQKYPRYPARQRLAVPAALAGELAAYVGGMQRVIAPRGWRCKVQEAVDGSDVITVEPRGAGSHSSISSWSIPACVGCMFDSVCAYFPHEAKAVSVGLPCEVTTSGERTTRLSRTLVRTQAKTGSSYGLVLFEPRTPTSMRPG